MRFIYPKEIKPFDVKNCSGEKSLQSQIKRDPV